MLPRTAAFFLILFPLFLGAQTNYKAGYIVTHAGDTVHGFINYKEWHQNPSKIGFNRNPDSPAPQTFSAADVRAFAVTGYESYELFTVSVSLDQVRPDRLSEQIDTSAVTKPVFLKEVLRGDRLHLYSYKDEVKERFYIRRRQQEVPQELLLKKTLKDLQVTTLPLYRQQLLLIAVELGVFTTDMDRLIQAALYTKGDLKKIVHRLNTKNETAFASAGEQTRRANFFVSAGLARSHMKFSGENLITVDRLDEMGRDKYKSHVQTTFYLPRVAAGMDFYFNPAIRRLVIRTEISVAALKAATTSYYKHSNYNDAENENTYRFSALEFSLVPQVLYHIYNSDRIKWYAGAGGSFSFLKVRENSLEKKPLNQTNKDVVTEEDYLPIKSNLLRVLVRTGVQVNKRIDVSLLWTNPAEYTSFAIGHTYAKGGSLAVAATYLLRK